MTFSGSSLIAVDQTGTVPGGVIKPGDTSWDVARRLPNLGMHQYIAAGTGVVEG